MSKSLIAKTMAAIAAGSMLVAVAGCSEQKKEETKTEAPAAAPAATRAAMAAMATSTTATLPHSALDVLH